MDLFLFLRRNFKKFILELAKVDGKLHFLFSFLNTLNVSEEDFQNKLANTGLIENGFSKEQIKDLITKLVIEKADKELDDLFDDLDLKKDGIIDLEGF